MDYLSEPRELHLNLLGGKCLSSFMEDIFLFLPTHPCFECLEGGLTEPPQSASAYVLADFFLKHTVQCTAVNLHGTSDANDLFPADSWYSLLLIAV